MPLSRRYTPEFAPGETSVIGMDFSYVIPPGVGIQNADVGLFLNARAAARGSPVSPADPNDYSISAASWLGRTLYATLTLEHSALDKDFLVIWECLDFSFNHWSRSAMLMCTYTS